MTNETGNVQQAHIQEGGNNMWRSNSISSLSGCFYRAGCSGIGVYVDRRIPVTHAGKSDRRVNLPCESPQYIAPVMQYTSLGQYTTHGDCVNVVCSSSSEGPCHIWQLINFSVILATHLKGPCHYLF